MEKKELFIHEVLAAIDGLGETPEKYFSEDALTYFNALRMDKDISKSPTFTENGAKILKYIQENKDSFGNLFKAKDIAEGLNITSRSASGAMRKLVTDGFLEKIGEKPICYSLTIKGREVVI